MSLHHVSSGEIVDLRPLGDGLRGTVSSALLKTENLELMRLVLPAGRSIPEHVVAGELTVYCIEGIIELEAHQRTLTLHAGELVYLEARQPYALRAIEDASLLVTMLLQQGTASPLDLPPG